MEKPGQGRDPEEHRDRDRSHDRQVAAAFLALGGRNAWTPSATASTPVRAVDPEAKARRMTRAPIAVTGSRSTVRRDGSRALAVERTR